MLASSSIMRLLNTETLEFEEFVDLPEEPYAILSHRWGAEEVSYKEYRKTRALVKGRSGYKKIVKFCEIAQQRGYRLAWVDTCCIDKRSSAELSEAINSMYRWYGESAECFVWLEDYEVSGLDKTALAQCKWFTRGWTLQELLAPSCCTFFSASWDVVGHKHGSKNHNDTCVCQQGRGNRECGTDITPDLARITSINLLCLTSRDFIPYVSAAERMSWASNRVTTRLEDRAYSLLGLFQINMPLLYGEGTKAFRRLQEEIIKDHEDLSILCFNDPLLFNPKAEILWDTRAEPILAKSPDAFREGDRVTCSTVKRARLEPALIASQGIRMRLCAYETVIECPLNDGMQIARLRVYALPLDCSQEARLAKRRPLYLIVSEAGSGRRRACRKFTVGFCDLESEDEFGVPHWSLHEDKTFYITSACC